MRSVEIRCLSRSCSDPHAYSTYQCFHAHFDFGQAQQSVTIEVNQLEEKVGLVFNSVVVRLHDGWEVWRGGEGGLTVVLKDESVFVSNRIEWPTTCL